MEQSSVQVKKNQWNCWNLVHYVQFLYPDGIGSDLKVAFSLLLPSARYRQEGGRPDNATFQLFCFPPRYKRNSEKLELSSVQLPKLGGNAGTQFIKLSSFTTLGKGIPDLYRGALSEEMANLSNFEEFCGGAFWDLDLTWNTKDPYFTPCFEVDNFTLFQEYSLMCPTRFKPEIYVCWTYAVCQITLQ